jgi:hypothetical protein
LKQICGVLKRIYLAVTFPHLVFFVRVQEQHHQQNISRGWDGSTLSKEEMGAVVRSREEAAMKRVRALQYASLQNVKTSLIVKHYVLQYYRTRVPRQS